MNLKILNNKEIKNILAVLDKQFGFKGKLDYVFLRSEKNKIYLVNKDIARIDLDKIKVNSLGVYFGTVEAGIRLSIEGAQLIGPSAKKNVVALREKEMKQWLRGENIEHNGKEEGFVILKHKEDFIGCGKISKGLILNYVAKTRRVNV